jgi:predicted hydrocarbon binding protein
MAKQLVMQERYRFTWDDLGDIEQGRPHLGPTLPVAVYRLMQYTMKEALEAELGQEKTGAIFVEAGRRAGQEFCKNVLNTKLKPDAFLAQLQSKLKELAVGIMRLERVDLDKMELFLNISEDLDCSGLPCTNEVVCQYDEGFIAGVFEAYTGRSYVAKEIDCWASGDRVCRFQVKRR